MSHVPRAKGRLVKHSDSADAWLILEHVLRIFHECCLFYAQCCHISNMCTPASFSACLRRDALQL